MTTMILTNVGTGIPVAARQRHDEPENWNDGKYARDAPHDTRRPSVQRDERRQQRAHRDDEADLDERQREIGIVAGETISLRLPKTDEQRGEADVGRRDDGE